MVLEDDLVRDKHTVKGEMFMFTIFCWIDIKWLIHKYL